MAWNNQLSSVPGAADNGVHPQASAVPSQAPPMNGAIGFNQAHNPSMQQGAVNAVYNPAYNPYNIPSTTVVHPTQQMPPAGQYQQNPTYPPQQPSQPSQSPQMPYYASRTSPQAARMPAAGSYDGQAILGAQPGTDSDQSDTHDDVWIDRTKQAIAETQNDPHRQVQLLQHLSVLYLKERFNREVQTDKG